MSRAINSYWIDDRIRTQRVALRESATLPSVRELSLELIGTRAEVSRRGGIIPAWVIFGMIILATSALCVTITMRTQSQVRAAAGQFEKMQVDVDALEKANNALRTQIRNLSNDPRTIESAARAQLNMARANEIIVAGE